MDVTAVSARLAFDCRARVARAEATVDFTIDGDGGQAWFDLRQTVETATLDGRALEGSEVAHDAHGLRRPGPDPGPGAHRLELAYRLDRPDCPESIAPGWTHPGPGVVFDLWMSDLFAGRYLEMWVPAPLCHDRFALTLEIVVEGAGPHRVFANGAIRTSPGATGFSVSYPPSFTSLSPMLVVVPEGRYDLVATEEGPMTVETFKLAGPEIDLAACHRAVTAHLAHDAERFGPYGHGSRFSTYVWGSPRGMEYDGATTASVDSLEHEVLHSWFGRGVKPATAADGWIDEAFTTWYTASPPRRRRWAEAFDWSEPPVQLRPSTWPARSTPRQAYREGARLFAGVADVIGVDGLCDSMGELYRRRVGGFVSTDELEAHLCEAAGAAVAKAFARWVHGQGDR